MTAKATFNIDGSFKLTGRGLVIYGDVLDGEIRAGSFISFNDGIGMTTLQTVRVEFVDIIGTDNISKIGLIFRYAIDKQKADLESLKVAKQLVKISER